MSASARHGERGAAGADVHDGTALFGKGVAASGEGVAASGDGTAASGDGTAAFGDGTAAFGDGTAAFGDGTAAFGDGTAAFGDGVAALGERAAPTGDGIVRRIDIPHDHPAFDGHFPGQPILPGAALLAEVLEAACSEPRLAALVGSAPKLGVVKFLLPVLPGARIDIGFRITATSLDFSVAGEAARLHASGQLQRADLQASGSVRAGVGAGAQKPA